MSMKYPSQGNASNDRVEVCFAKKSHPIESALSRWGVFFAFVWRREGGAEDHQAVITAVTILPNTRSLHQFDGGFLYYQALALIKVLQKFGKERTN